MKSDSYLINLDPNQIMNLMKTKLDGKDFNLKIVKESQQYEFSVSIHRII